MATPEIAAAMALIPSKKAELREAFESLQSLSSLLASFTIKWQDLEDHFAALEQSIVDRLRDLEEKSRSASASASLPDVKVEPDFVDDSNAVKTEATAAGDEPLRQIPTPNPELQSLCVNMDGVGLRSYLVTNRKKIAERLPEIGAAIMLAPEPAKLVLDAISVFCRPKSEGEKDGEFYATRRTCFSLLEELQELSLEFSPSVRVAVEKMAREWKGKIESGGELGAEAWLLLQLLVSYKLVPKFEIDGIMELFVPVARRKQAPVLCKKLGLVEHMPDLIQKLKNKSRHLDAVNLIDSLGLSNKYPPVPILKAYLKDSKKAAREMRKKGNNYANSQNIADVKELTALKAVAKAVENYKLEPKYKFFYIVKNRITTLEQRKARKKRPASSSVANLETQIQHQQQLNKRPRQTTSSTVALSASSPIDNLEPQIQHNQQLNKRPHPLTSSTVAFAASSPGANLEPQIQHQQQLYKWSRPLTSSNHPYPPLPQNHSQMGLADQQRYMGSFGSYGLSTRGSYDAPLPSIAGLNFGASASHSPRPYIYSSEYVSGPGLYDRPATYGDYSLSGLPDRYESPFYPRV